MAAITELQGELTQQFRQIIANDQLSQAYIFAGARGTGKEALAQWIAQRLFCTNLQDGMPCGECAECKRIASGNNPDVLTVRPDGLSIKTEAVRNLKEEMSKSSVEGHARVFIIEDADKMTVSAENSLLKFFEEPLPGMLIILTTTAKNQLLPTVLSRAQIINFPAPARKLVLAQLRAGGVSTHLAGLIAGITSDIPGGIALAADEEFTNRLGKILGLCSLLAKGDSLAFPYIQTDIVKQVTGRDEQRQVLQILGLVYSEALSRSYGREPLVLPDSDALTELSRQSSAQLANALAVVLEGTGLLNSNVAFQALLEQLVLRILKGSAA
ncbi:DNA polymerase III subunit delta' [Lacticaseibacillus zhaodongensis]|uniref:DNA polymerase III subunit delta' n=1 Tax=Lacticaseibacillus zhaodongensis TaxID=2668065 RepID=UPI0012D2A29E|nr:DNA polymerase III subunit delta' [Lacticaseibacillus zhaodongensis]